MSQKLYRVTVEFTYYAVADTSIDAESHASDAFHDEDWMSIASAQQVSQRELPDWDGDALVYGPDKDTTLDEALAAQGLPSVAELRDAWKARLPARP